MTYNRETSYSPNAWDSVQIDAEGNLQGMLSNKLANNTFIAASKHSENKKKEFKGLPITKIAIKHNHRGQVIR